MIEPGALIIGVSKEGILHQLQLCRGARDTLRLCQHAGGILDAPALSLTCTLAQEGRFGTGWAGIMTVVVLQNPCQDPLGQGLSTLLML